MRRTKIVATLGPASASAAVIRQLVEAGADVFRLNFSHGTREEHRQTIHRIRAVCQETGRDVAILQDLGGPKIRVGEVAGGAADLISGSEVTITTATVPCTAKLISTNYAALPRDVHPGSRILIDDGKIQLEVLSVTGDEVRCTVKHGGKLTSRKGVNLPGTRISSPTVTAKDLLDLSVGLEEEVDFVALSFVRRPEDIETVRRIAAKHDRAPRIIAKIEKPEALEHLDLIIEAADGVLVARGDLGVEMDLQRVPRLQKEIIFRANRSDKYVITATQMLESMTHNPSPTRAEVSDVANAIVDGSDAVMLSGETATGKYPVATVTMAAEIAKDIEIYLETHRPAWNWTEPNYEHPVQDALGNAVLQLCKDLRPKAIVAFTASGGTALYLSKCRPFAPILGFTARADSFRRMRLAWGVTPVLNPDLHSNEEFRAATLNYVHAQKLARPGDYLLLVFGTPFGQVMSTNSIEVTKV